MLRSLQLPMLPHDLFQQLDSRLELSHVAIEGTEDTFVGQRLHRVWRQDFSAQPPHASVIVRTSPDFPPSWNAST